MGEIRLQWWRDALTLPPELRTGHPVADAVRHTAQAQGLSTELLEAPIDGNLLILDSASPPTEDVLTDLLWKTEGALFALGAQVVGLSASPEVDAGCTAAGQAYGAARLLFGLPHALAHQRVPLAQVQLVTAGLTAEELLAGVADARIELLIAACSAQIRGNLDVARQFAARLPRTARVPFLPLALVEPYLRAVGWSGRAFLREETRVSPLARVCRIAAAHLFGRL